MKKVALVHDYLTRQDRVERILQLLCERYPNADVFTSLYNPEITIDLGKLLVDTSAIQIMLWVAKYFRLMASLYFLAFIRKAVTELQPS